MEIGALKRRRKSAGNSLKQVYYSEDDFITVKALSKEGASP